MIKVQRDQYLCIEGGGLVYQVEVEELVHPGISRAMIGNEAVRLNAQFIARRNSGAEEVKCAAFSSADISTIYRKTSENLRIDNHFSGEDCSSNVSFSPSPSLSNSFFYRYKCSFGNWLMRYNIGYEAFSMSLDKRAWNGILGVRLMRRMRGCCKHLNRWWFGKWRERRQVGLTTVGTD